MKPILIGLVVILIGVLSLGGYIFSQKTKNLLPTPTPTFSPANIPPKGPITIKGQLVCLPHTNTNGPQTLECAFGLKDDTNRYFALHDSDPQYQNISGIPTNAEIEVQGNFTPQQDNKYQSIGIIEVTKITQGLLQLPTKYISPVDWPPKVVTDNKPFTCIEDGAGQTKKQVVNNHTYCVTKVTEGAAGSIYTQYAYAVEQNNKTEIFSFSVKFVQCGNYPEPEKTACETERQTFNIDNFADQYIQSYKVSNENS